MRGRFATFDMEERATENAGRNVETSGGLRCPQDSNSSTAMKTRLLCLGLASLLSVPVVQAQVFRPETVRGAVAGGIVGAVVGHNDGRRGWEGAAYGAVAGALIGSFVGESRERHQPPVPVYRRSHVRPFHEPWGPAHTVRIRGGRDPWVFRGYPGRMPAPVYRYYGYEGRRGHPSHASTGLLVGGALGAVIGHNDGRRGWEGAAIGAGAGWLFGTLADREAARREAERRAAEEAWQASLQREVAPAAAAPVVHHHHYYQGQPPAGSMASANGLFGR